MQNSRVSCRNVYAQADGEREGERVGEIKRREGRQREQRNWGMDGGVGQRFLLLSFYRATFALVVEEIRHIIVQCTHEYVHVCMCESVCV